MEVGIIDFGYVHGKKNIGSVRIRVEWLIKYWPEAEKYKLGKKYDALIFQKAYLTEVAETFDGVKILDVCDPDFYDMASFVKMISKVDAVTCSSPKLTELISKWTDKPVIHIPDRIDFESLPKKIKKHEGEAKKVVWFGYGHNSHTLKQVIPYLKQYNLEMIIISDTPVDFSDQEFNEKVTWYKHTPETWNDHILEGDIVLFPPSLKYKDVYKSNNKTVHSWALGMPVATTLEELNLFLDPNERNKEQEKRLKEVTEQYDVKLSVKQYQELIDDIKKGK